MKKDLNEVDKLKYLSKIKSTKSANWAGKIRIGEVASTSCIDSTGENYKVEVITKKSQIIYCEISYFFQVKFKVGFKAYTLVRLPIVIGTKPFK